jgi:hypothetical protein
MSKKEILEKLKTKFCEYIEKNIYQGSEVNEIKNLSADNLAVMLRLKIIPLSENQREQLVLSSIPNHIVINNDHRNKCREYVNAMIELLVN